MEGYFVNLSNEWFKNGDNESLLQKYGSDSMVIYTLLLRNLTYRNNIIFSLNELGDKLNIKQNNTRMVNKLKGILLKMNNQIIEVYQDSNFLNKVNSIEYNKIYHSKILIDIPKEQYFQIFDEDIDKLLEGVKNKNINKFEIVTYLIFLLSCMGSKEGEENYKVCYPSIEYSSKICSINEKSIIRYNGILEELKIIAIDNAGMNRDVDNGFKNVNNTYSRYIDKDILNKSVEEHRKNVQIAVDYNTKKTLQNKSRGKAKEISMWKNKHDIYNLTESEYNELYLLEKEHYQIRMNIVHDAKKIHINGGYLTLYPTKNGEKKSYANYKLYTKKSY